MSTSDVDPTGSVSTREDLAALLQWYVAMGVDGAVDEVPHDRFAESAIVEAARLEARAAAAATPPARSAPAQLDAPARTAPVPRTVGRDGAAAIGADEAVRAAREAASRATNLEELRAELEGFEGCILKRTASKLVFGAGDPNARLMIIGEAPEDDEDRQGLPFVGTSGELLDNMLGAIGLERSAVYLANIVPWRPPGNRNPNVQEIAACQPFLARMITLVDPELVLCLGNYSAQNLLGLRDGITKTRGKWVEMGIEPGRSGRRHVKAIPSFSLKYVLMSLESKSYVWADLRSLQKALDGLPPKL